MRKLTSHNRCETPEFTNLLEYQKFCTRRLVTDFPIAITEVLLGSFIILPISLVSLNTNIFELTILTLINHNFLIISCIWTIYVILLLYRLKRHKRNIIHPIGFILFSVALFFLDLSITTDLNLNTSGYLIVIIVLAISGILLFSIGIPSAISIISSLINSHTLLVRYCECNSQGPHTGIILPINVKRLGDISDSGCSILAEGLQRNGVEPYRVYFVFTREQFRGLIINPLIQNVWIFGHGSRGSVDLSDGIFHYDELDGTDIVKGYVKQYHCNCTLDEHDRTSLVDLSVDPAKRDRSVDTGIQKRFVLLLSLNRHKNVRNLITNYFEIRTYLKEQKFDTIQNKK